MTQLILKQRISGGVIAAALALSLVAAFPAPVRAAQNTAVLLSVEETYRLEDGDGFVSDAATTGSLAGRTLYFPVYSRRSKASPAYQGAVTETTALTDAELESFRIDFSVTQGASLVEERPYFVRKESAAGGEQLFLALALRDTYRNSPADMLKATITIQAANGCSVRSAEDGGSSAADNRYQLPIEYLVQYGTAQITSDGAHQVAAESPLVQFAPGVKQAILCFDDGAEIEGDFSAEQELFLSVSTWDANLQERYPDVAIWKFKGNRKTFSKEVTVRIPAEPVEGPGGKPQAPLLYDLEQGPEALSAEYSAEEGAFFVSTRTPGCYLVSANPLS